MEASSEERERPTSSFVVDDGGAVGDSLNVVPRTGEHSELENIDDKDKRITPPGTEAVDGEEEDFVIFHNVSYLGAAKIQEANNEAEIQSIIKFLNEQSGDQAIQVSVSVPFYSDGEVGVYEEENQQEISKFKINQIIFFARSTATAKNDSACFAFTCSHGKNIQEAIFQCHTFRCDVPEAVGRVYQSFSTAFSAPPKQVEEKLVGTEQSAITPETYSANMDSVDYYTVFEVSLTLKEDDGKGTFHAVPRDKGYFKLKSLVSKQMELTVQQIPGSGTSGEELIVERCFGVLLSPGRHVRESDMDLCEMLSWSIGSSGSGRRSYVVTGHWDCNDPAFVALNQETPKESYIFLTIAVDLVIKGIRDPLRFPLEIKARIYSATERFWVLTRKHHVTHQFGLALQKVPNSKSSLAYKVVECRALGEVDKSKTTFNLNFTSFIRSSSVGSIELETPSKDDEDSDDDEPLQSGVGEITKDCSDEQIVAWSEILNIWPIDAPRPKQLASLVRSGIPGAMRSTMWMRLANITDETELFEVYKNLLSKECSNEDVILRDISRTFPANDYFKESAGQDQLYKICRAYALVDSEVGYTQGISFIGAALLLQVPEEQSFSLLVKIMFDCGLRLRELYSDGFDGLHLTHYTLDKCVQDQIPELWKHFQELGVESHMYSSQWFLTCFCGKFPLNFVFRVIDLVLLDGRKAIFQIAIALLATSRKDLLVLDFEGVLKYFRVCLPKKYRNPEATNALINTACNIKLKRLKRYMKEYIAIKEQERNYVDPISRLTNDNKKLMEDSLRYEYTVTNLVLGKTNSDEKCLQLEDELNRTKMTLQETQEMHSQMEEETLRVKELFQREVKQYDLEGNKKDNIISEYKQICSKLSSQLEMEQKLSRERMKFFQANLCPTCFQFVTTAINISSNSKSNESPQHHREEMSLEDIVKPLENELAKTKIALAESESRNDEMSHKLQTALAELETYRNSSPTGPAWLWKNLSFNKDHKKVGATSSLPPEEHSLTHSQSMPPIIPSFPKK